MDGSEYTGEYFDDKPHGHGIYIWKDGEQFEGDW